MKKLFSSEDDKKEIQKFREQLSSTKLDSDDIAESYGAAEG